MKCLAYLKLPGSVFLPSDIVINQRMSPAKNKIITVVYSTGPYQSRRLISGLSVTGGGSTLYQHPRRWSGSDNNRGDKGLTENRPAGMAAGVCQKLLNIIVKASKPRQMSIQIAANTNNMLFH